MILNNRKKVEQSENKETKKNQGNLQINGLNIIFKSARGEKVYAVKDFSVQAKPGEFVCLVGPSGCGKSTVLNTVAGFVKPTIGEVTLDEEPILHPSPERGIVFQDYALFPWLSVQNNVEFGLKMRGMRKEKRQKIAKEKLSQVGLSGFQSKYPHELSGGMQQRVAIARILASNPTVMLMDEPFGALDAQTRVLMQELLLSVWDQYRTTVIFVTHDLDESIFLADRIVIMTARPGQVKSIVDNPLPRPRDIKMQTSNQYIDIKTELTEILREEIDLVKSLEE